MHWIRQFILIIKRLLPVIIIFSIIYYLSYNIICQKYTGLLTLISSVLEIYGVLLILLGEIESSSLMNRWDNPKLKNIKGSLTTTNKFVIINSEKENYYIGLGHIIFLILYYAKSSLNIWTNIKSSWYWLWHKPNAKNCKISYDLSVIPEGSEKHTQYQIDKIKEYPKIKILGFAILFFAYILQLVYLIITTKIKQGT